MTIGRWRVEFYFAPDGYDADLLLDRLYEIGAPARIMREALDLMDSGKDNTGYTFCNPYEFEALVVIGPTSSGAEFIDTLVHEIQHLAVNIAESVGADLESETPAYIAGDSARALSKVICQLGCPNCR